MSKLNKDTKWQLNSRSDGLYQFVKNDTFLTYFKQGEIGEKTWELSFEHAGQTEDFWFHTFNDALKFLEFLDNECVTNYAGVQITDNCQLIML